MSGPRTLFVSRIILAVLVSLALGASPALSAPPNILLVLTDDQRADTLDVMPSVRALAAQGVSFQQSFVTTPLCGPSRASLLTGQYAHHTGVLTNLAPHGGVSAFDASQTIATALHAAGYTTAYFGKYLNGYNQISPAVPPGWDTWQAIVGDGGLYYDYPLNVNGVVQTYGSAPEDYSTDVLRGRVTTFLQTHTTGPWFAVFAPEAPHGPAIPAPRHVGRYAGIKPWRPKSYEEADVTDKPAPYWHDRKAVWSQYYIDYNDKLRQRQLETLLAVDEAVAAFMATLQSSGQAFRTIVIYTSDNGEMLGEHWMSGSKACPYDECLRVPLVIGDPYATPYVETERMVLNLDLAPTIAQLAGATLPGMDGRTLMPLLRSKNPRRLGVTWRSDFLAEGWNLPDEPRGGDPPTFASVRTNRWKYIRTPLANGVFEEMYDLGRDRWEREGGNETNQEAAQKGVLRTRLLELQH